MLIDRAVSLSAARSLPSAAPRSGGPRKRFLRALSLTYMAFASMQAYQRDSDAGEPCGVDHDNLAAGGTSAAFVRTEDSVS